MLLKHSRHLTGFREAGLSAGLREVREKDTEELSRERGNDPGKEGSERWGLEQQRERLTGQREGGLNENI